jgi:hypothetical protein
VIAVGILLVSRFYFLRCVQKYEQEYDEKVLELADYTVLVTGFPETMLPAHAESAICECVPEVQRPDICVQAHVIMLSQ